MSTELLDLEQMLRSFVPQPPQTPREQMLYQAGWDAALVQQASHGSLTVSAALLETSPRSSANSYWAAACAALLVLSTALGWQVWQEPKASPATMITTSPVTPQRSNPGASPELANTAITAENAEPRDWENSISGLVNYLELRERVTRGGLSMWPTSTSIPVKSRDANAGPARDWQAELFRETL